MSANPPGDFGFSDAALLPVDYLDYDPILPHLAYTGSLSVALFCKEQGHS